MRSMVEGAVASRRRKLCSWIDLIRARGWHRTPLSVEVVLGLGVFRDARLGWTPGGLSAEGPWPPKPFGLWWSRAAADVS